MITVRLNDKETTVEANTSIEQAIMQWSLSSQTFAVAVNEQFIPKSLYENTHLQEGDRIELLVPMQGG